MAIEKIIVLDDDLIIRKTLEQQLRQRRYSVASCETLKDVRQLIAKDNFDIIFIDVRLPDGEGTELLDDLKDSPNAPLVVMITGHGSVESAVTCMHKGAFDYIIKPFSFEQIEVVLKKAKEFNQLVKLNSYYSQQQKTESEIIGNSLAIQTLKNMLKKVAATEATVLITGENGTGKELVANELYKLSLLSDKPFIKVNCAAISENLIESEFFGHEKGSFTGATQRREGRFELANNGTILLDEIGEISPQIQAKLLRVLQEKEFERVGGNKTIKVKVRVLATTNRDLKAAVKNGEFREDLYYRLNVFPVEVPPLRDRAEDIPIIANSFLERFIRKHNLKTPGFSEKAINLMMSYKWAGNVRELQNTIERATIMSEDGAAITGEVLGLLTQIPSANIEGSESVTETGSSSSLSSADDGPPKSLFEVEKEHILKVLELTGGNRTKASKILDVNIRTLRNKLNLYNESE